MKNIKFYLSLIFSLLIWAIAYANNTLNFPTPSWVESDIYYEDILNNIKNTVWTNEYIQWFNWDWSLIVKSKSFNIRHTPLSHNKKFNNWDGVYSKYLSKVLYDCWDWRYVKGFDSNNNIICSDKNWNILKPWNSIATTLWFSFPTQVPNWGNQNWSLNNFFNLIWNKTCWTNQYLKWIDDNWNLICWDFINWTCWVSNWKSFDSTPTTWLCEKWNNSTVTFLNWNYSWYCNWDLWKNVSCSSNLKVDWVCWNLAWTCSKWTLTNFINSTKAWESKTWSCNWINWWSNVNCSVKNPDEFTWVSWVFWDCINWKKIRTVECYKNWTKTLDETSCNQNTKPESIQSCISTSCTPEYNAVVINNNESCPNWWTLNWDKCIVNCPTNWSCWDSNWKNFYTEPTQSLCKSWNKTTIWLLNFTYNWSCNWINWWANENCNAGQSKDGSCNNIFWTCKVWTVSNIKDSTIPWWTKSWICNWINWWVSKSCTMKNPDSFEWKTWNYWDCLNWTQTRTVECYKNWVKSNNSADCQYLAKPSNTQSCFNSCWKYTEKIDYCLKNHWTVFYWQDNQLFNHNSLATINTTSLFDNKYNIAYNLKCNDWNWELNSGTKIPVHNQNWTEYPCPKSINWVCWNANWQTLAIQPSWNSLCSSWSPTIVSTSWFWSRTWSWSCLWENWWTDSSCSANEEMRFDYVKYDWDASSYTEKYDQSFKSKTEMINIKWETCTDFWAVYAITRNILFEGWDITHTEELYWCWVNPSYKMPVGPGVPVDGSLIDPGWTPWEIIDDTKIYNEENPWDPWYIDPIEWWWDSGFWNSLMSTWW